ncbi:DUF262 domain-containing protein [Candidatus Nanohalovita haloferacivicina]|nr:DUF262 domain-containing protein [Candidatus Nanohalobia archaeon BNXNv]
MIDYSGKIDSTEVESVSQRNLMDIFDEDSTLKIKRKPLLEVLGEDFLVPRYQRLYSWKLEQHKDLWNEIEEMLDLEVFFAQENVQPTTKLTDVFFGSIFIADVDGDRLEVIDGQQRITTVFLILSLIKKKLEDLEVNGDLETMRTNAVDQIDRMIFRIPDDQLSKEPAITYSDAHNNELFLCLIGDENEKNEWLKSRNGSDGRKSDSRKVEKLAERLGTDVPSESPDHIYHPESNERLLQGFEFYQEKISERLLEANSDSEKAKMLINLKNYLLRSFIVGRVEIMSDSSPELRMNIFQSLNDRGLELTTVDLIRARIVNRFYRDDDEDEYVRIWERIVRDFGTDDKDIRRFIRTYLAAYEDGVSKLEEIDKDNILEAFSLKDRDSHEISSKIASIDDAKRFLQDLQRHAELYLDLVDYESAEFENLDEKNTKDILRRLGKLGTRQWRPLILKAYSHVDEDSSKDFLNLLETVEKIFLRLAISEYRANTLESTFVVSAHKLDENLENSVSVLLEEAEDDLSGLFGTDFVEVLIGSSNLSSNAARLILEKVSDQLLDKNNAGRPIQEEIVMKNTELEHILPQTFVREDSDDPLVWCRNFFASTDITLESVDRGTEAYQLIKKEFIEDMANMILLKDVDNSASGNKPFSKKINYYYQDDYFENIPTNWYFTGSNPDFSEDMLDATGSEDEFWNAYWNHENFLKRRSELFAKILFILAVKEDEFSDFIDVEENRIRPQDSLKDSNDNEIGSRLERLDFELEADGKLITNE